jgi:hypothetical protein
MQFLALDKMTIHIGTKDIADIETLPEEEMAMPVKLKPGKVVPLTNILTNISSTPLTMLKWKKCSTG